MIKFTSPLFLFEISVIIVSLMVLSLTEECITITVDIDPPISTPYTGTVDDPHALNDMGPTIQRSKFVEKCTNFWSYFFI